MASQQNKWREDQILIISPGSQITLAQLGCVELTPTAQRIPTRMFKDKETGGYRPYHTYKRKKTNLSSIAKGAKAEDEWEYVEDRDSVEGAIYPIVGGRIVNMKAFLAFLDHVHGLLTTTYHNTPIFLAASPRWCRGDCEKIAQYIFEKTKTPSLCMMDGAYATQYGLKWPNMTVVDIGFEKVDVTCIYEHCVVAYKGLGFPTPERFISGGEVFTQKLLTLLKDKGFTYDMAEQLKKSPLCEVLPYRGELNKLMELPTDATPTSASKFATTMPAHGDGPQIAIEPPKPAFSADNESESLEEKVVEEGVLDVANIVTSGNTREFLAKREKEKAEKAKSKGKGKGQESDSATTKPTRLPNNKRKFNVFHYEETIHEDIAVPVSTDALKPDVPAVANGAAIGPTAATTTAAEATVAPVVPTEPSSQAKPEANGETSGEGVKTSTEPTQTITERRTRRVRKDIEIGLERFLFADRGEIDRIVTTIYRAVQSIDGSHMRAACWDNVVFVGGGSRLRGLKDNIMQTLHARHLISPSTATIFTSELPSNIGTPTGTGSQTPTGSVTGQLPLPTTSSVNPLLQAATTASLGVPGSVQAPGSSAGDAMGGHHFHGQTPMSIKLAPMPMYITEWAKAGFEDAQFLGSCIGARLAFCIHNFDQATLEAQKAMSLTRVDFNESGPKAVRKLSMLVHI